MTDCLFDGRSELHCEGPRQTYINWLPVESLLYIFKLGLRDYVAYWMRQRDGVHDERIIPASDSNFDLEDGLVAGQCRQVSYPPEALICSRAQQKGDRKHIKDVLPEVLWKNRDFHTLPFELLVSWVCRRWRTISLDYAALWCNLIFTFQRHHTPLELQKEYIKRSQDMLLNIHIDFSRHRPPRCEPLQDCNAMLELCKGVFVDGILGLLLPHSSRWQCFECSLKGLVGGLVQDMLGSLCGVTVPALQRLRILRDSTMYSYKCALFCGNAPHLKSIELSGVWLDIIPLARSCNVHGGLTELTLDLPDISQNTFIGWIKELLDCTPNLTSLTYRGVSFHLDEKEGQPSDPVYLPMLRSLHIHKHTRIASTFIRMLHSPALELLKLTVYHSDDIVQQLCVPMYPIATIPCTRSILSILENVTELRICLRYCRKSATNQLYSALPWLQSLDVMIGSGDIVLLSIHSRQHICHPPNKYGGTQLMPRP